MSCRTTRGGTVANRFARAYSGLPDKDVQALFHALKREGADLPPPDQLDIEAWAVHQRMLLKSLNLTPRQRELSERDLALALDEHPDAGTFYAWSHIETRARQEAVLRSIDTAVDLDPPGSHRDRYILDADGNPAEVWYASYGSNLNRERFMAYIEGGTPSGSTTHHDGARDKTPPADDIPIRFNGRLHFAYASARWGGGGVGFIDNDHVGHALGRAYRITGEQFADVIAQENGRTVGNTKLPFAQVLSDGRAKAGYGVYDTLVHIGDYDGAPVLTFTGNFTAADSIAEAAEEERMWREEERREEERRKAGKGKRKRKSVWDDEPTGRPAVLANGDDTPSRSARMRDEDAEFEWAKNNWKDPWDEDASEDALYEAMIAAERAKLTPEQRDRYDSWDPYDGADDPFRDDYFDRAPWGTPRPGRNNWDDDEPYFDRTTSKQTSLFDDHWISRTSNTSSSGYGSSSYGSSGSAATTTPSKPLWTVASNEPTGNYLRMIHAGLAQTFGLTEQQAADYLRGCPGAETWGRRQLLKVLRAPEPTPVPTAATRAVTATGKASQAPAPAPTRSPGKKPKKTGDRARDRATQGSTDHTRRKRVGGLGSSGFMKPCVFCTDTGHDSHNCPVLIRSGK